MESFCAKCAKGVVLFILACAAAAAAALALGLALLALALVIVLLLAALILNPAGVRALMRQAVGPDMGVKASGGVHTKEEALSMIEAGANRIGASASVSIMKE